MSFKHAICVLFVSLFFQQVNSSSCGSAAIPFTFEALSDGQPVLGCARPKCFGWNVDSKVAGSTSKFSLINNRLDGYIKEDDFEHISNEDSQYFKPQIAICESAYNSENCNGDNKWVGGISASLDVSRTPLAVQCCEYEPLRNSTDRGVAVINPGQIVIGGDILKEGRLYAFDYISNVVKNRKEDGTVYYDVSVRRVTCIPHPKEITVKVDHLLTDEIRGGFSNFENQRAQAFQAPTFVGSESAPLQEISNVASQAGQSAVQQNYYGQSYSDASASQNYYGNGYSYGNSQGSGYSAVNTQGSDAGSSFLQFCPSMYCFSADTNVRLSNGEIKRMDELNINDWVLSADDSQIAFSNVKYWIHKMPKLKAEFIRIELTDGKVLKITSKHYIYKTECSRENELIPFDKMNHIPIFAEKVEIGDCLYVLSEGRKDSFEERRVRKIDIVEEVGIYAPMTSSNNIIVNDIYASCFNIVNDKFMQGSFLENFNKLPAIGSIFGTNENVEADLPYGTSLIVELMKYVLPTSGYSF